MKQLSLIIILVLSMSQFAFSQDSTETTDTVKTEKPTKELTRKERRKLKREMKRFAKRILKDEELSRKYYEIITTCDQEDEECQKRLQELVEDSAQGSALSAQATGMTFGICHLAKDSKKLHKVVYSKKSYDCKLSSHGKVYDKKINRKLYGLGLWWDKQSIVLMCTGPAYGKKMTGSTLAAGAFYGITLTTLVGKVGICLAVGAGKSAGFYIGADQYKFDE